MVAVAVYLALAAITLCYTYYRFLYRKQKAGEPPLAPGHFLYGSGKDFSNHAVKFLWKMRNKLGKVFTIRLLNKHWTMLLDVHSFERFSREKNFDFFTVQEQVNRNVFQFNIVNAEKVIAEVSQKVNGKYLYKTMDCFAQNLANTLGGTKKKITRPNPETKVTEVKTVINNNNNKNQDSDNNDYKKNNNMINGKGPTHLYDKIGNNHHQTPLQKHVTSQETNEWKQDYLKNFASEIFFSTVFYTIFGRGVPGQEGNFQPQVFYKNFDKFHKYFNYLWLGLPRWLFPAAGEAINILGQQPSSKEMVQRDGCSEYIRHVTKFMLKNNQTEAEIMGHNLVFLHVNYNTFRVVHWCMYKLMDQPEAMAGLRKEVEEVIESKRVGHNHDDEDEELEFTIEDINKMPVLDSFIHEVIRYYSGVFMVRNCIEDTNFTLEDGTSYNIRKGDKIALYPPVFHHDPEIFHEPELFKHDRFVNAEFFKDGKKVKHPVIGFGSVCPGQKLSILEVKWYLINLINMSNFELLEGEKTLADTTLYGQEILPPVSDVMVRMQQKQEFSALKFQNNYGAKSNISL